jgi:transcriptional regulator with XRE-family HTH domain
MRTSKALERLRAIEASEEFENIQREQLPYRTTALAVVTLRAELHLTQQQLAAMVGTTQSVIARLESGRHPAELTLLNRIAEAAGKPLQVEFGRTDIRIAEHEPERMVAETRAAYPTSGDELLDAFNDANTSRNWTRARRLAAHMEQEPLTPRRRVALALTAANRHDHEAAASWAEAALGGELPPASRDVAILIRGRSLLHRGNPRLALRALSEPDSGSHVAWLIRAAMADAHVELGNGARAMAEVQRALAMAPDVSEAHYHAARTAWHADRIWDALSHIAIYRAAAPDNRDGLMLHGSILGYFGSHHDDQDALRTALTLFDRARADGDCEAIRLYAVTAARLGDWRKAFSAGAKLLRHRGDEQTGECQHTRMGQGHREYVNNHLVPDALQALGEADPPALEAAVDEAVKRFGQSPYLASQRALARAVAADLRGTLSALGLDRGAIASASASDQVIVAAAMYSRRDYAGAYEILRRVEADLTRPSGLLRLAECAAAAGEFEEAQRVLIVLGEDDDDAAHVSRVALSVMRLRDAVSRAAQQPDVDLRWFALTGSSEHATPRESPWEGEHHRTTPMLDILPWGSGLN